MNILPLLTNIQLLLLCVLDAVLHVDPQPSVRNPRWSPPLPVLPRGIQIYWLCDEAHQQRKLLTSAKPPNDFGEYDLVGAEESLSAKLHSLVITLDKG